MVSSSWAADLVDVNGVQAARAFRAFRIAFLLKGSIGRKVNALFQTLVVSVAPSINICLLLFLHFTVFSILGMQVFHVEAVSTTWHHNLTSGRELGQIQQSSSSNFFSYWSSMRMLFECMAGKDWKIVMFDHADQPATGFWFFFTHYLLAVFILTNLFVAIIVDGYAKAKRETDLVITRNNIVVFQRVWEATMVAHGCASSHYIHRAHRPAGHFHSKI